MMVYTVWHVFWPKGRPREWKASTREIQKVLKNQFGYVAVFLSNLALQCRSHTSRGENCNWQRVGAAMTDCQYLVGSQLMCNMSGGKRRGKRGGGPKKLQMKAHLLIRLCMKYVLGRPTLFLPSATLSFRPGVQTLSFRLWSSLATYLLLMTADY